MTGTPFPDATEPEENSPASILSLVQLTEPPQLYGGEMFRRYPGMKLGRMPDVDFFAEKLCDLASGILAAGTADDAWALTAPAYYHLPAGANLLAERMHAMLNERGIDLPLVDLRLSFEQIAVRSLEEFRFSHHYASSPLAQRIAERQRMEDAASADMGWLRFAGHKVIIVNDIYVTGTQQRFMQRALAAAGAKECHWLYIFRIDGELARTRPQIEHAINNSSLSDADSFAALLSDATTRPTARCLSRLFNEEPEPFRRLVDKVPPQARERLYRLAKEERRYDTPLFAEKMRLLSDIN